MQEDESVVTAPVDTQDKSDRIEVETNIETTPENSGPDKGSKPEVEPKEAPQEKTVNPRTEKRKAEKERLIRENAALRERNSLYEQQITKAEPKPKTGDTPYTDFTKEPNIADYDDVLAYTRDVNKYDAHNMLSEREKQQEQTRADQAVDNSYIEKLRPLAQTNPELINRIAYLDESGFISKDLEKAVKSSPLSDKITEYLGNLPDQQIAQISRMSQNEIYKGIGILEAQLSQTDKEEAPRISKTPPPIKPPGNGAKTDRSISSYSEEEIENMPISEFKKLTNMR